MKRNFLSEIEVINKNKCIPGDQTFQKFLESSDEKYNWMYYSSINAKSGFFCSVCQDYVKQYQIGVNKNKIHREHFRA
jgi:hypothetical protein